MAYTGKKLETKLYDTYTKAETDTKVDAKVNTSDIQTLVETYSPPTDLSPYSTTAQMNSAISTAVDDLSPSVIVAPNNASDPSTGVVGQLYYNTTDNVLLNYNGSYWQPAGSGRLGTESNPAPSAAAIVAAGDDLGDGLYWLRNPNINNGASFQAYCDMTKDGGGWILVLTVRGDSISYMGWNDSLVQLRNEMSPSILNPYSIISWSDELKNQGSTWEWMVEATNTYTTRYTYGGRFRANVASYSLNTTTHTQTNITAMEWFNLSGFEENNGIGPRVPWRGAGGSELAALYTTYPNASSWWGTIVQNNTNYSTYNTGPWLSPAFQAPLFKRVWIR